MRAQKLQATLDNIYITVYTYGEVIDMETAKIFMNGQSQAVRLPKSFRFPGNEVGIQKVGNIVMLFAVDFAWEEFIKSSPVTDDFGETILAARKENFQQEREPL